MTMLSVVGLGGGEMGVHHLRHANWHPLTWLSHALSRNFSGRTPRGIVH